MQCNGITAGDGGEQAAGGGQRLGGQGRLNGLRRAAGARCWVELCRPCSCVTVRNVVCGVPATKGSRI